VQAIVDGVHLADDTVRVVAAAAPGRLALVSDAIAAAGAGEGSFLLGGVEVEVRDGVCRRPDGALAGSATPLVEAMRRLHALGVPLLDAVAAVTAIPARIARRPDVGVLRVGGPADLVRLDDALEITAVLLAGEEPVPA